MGIQQVSEWFRGNQRVPTNGKSADLQGENDVILVSIEKHGSRENSRRELRESLLRALQKRSGIDACNACGRFTIVATPSLGGLLVILTLFDFLGQAFFFAQLLETSEHLFDAFAATSLDSNRHREEVLTETSLRNEHETRAS